MRCACFPEARLPLDVLPARPATAARPSSPGADSGAVRGRSHSRTSLYDATRRLAKRRGDDVTIILDSPLSYEDFSNPII